MIADALRAEIERCSLELRSSNPLFTRAQEGSLTPDHLVAYLSSIHQLVLHSPVHLDLAHHAASKRGDATLAAHFRHKVGEELGHDAWAERDLAKVSAMRRRPLPSSVAPSMRALLSYIESVIDTDPRHYLAYILVAEYVTVLLGPDWLALLESRCGIPRTSMTVVANHAELDKDHTEEAFESIDSLVAEPRQLGPMRNVVRRAMDLFSAFCAEVVEMTDRELSHRSAHAPAA